MRPIWPEAIIENFMQKYDAIVIGTGQSGPSLARRLIGAGQSVAVVERKFFGGTCVNTGCTPTKTLVASAYAAHLARRAAEFGVTIPGPVTVDMKAVKARKDYVLGLSRNGVERSLKTLDGCTVYEGHGRFIVSEFGGGRRSGPGGRPHLHQCRWARACPADRRIGPESNISPTARMLDVGSSAAPPRYSRR